MIEAIKKLKQKYFQYIRHTHLYITTAKMDENCYIDNFVSYLHRTNQLGILGPISADGTPNMKFKENRVAYEKYLLSRIPKYECPICLEEKCDEACKLKCGHVFCVECFAGLVRTSNRCAMCRRDITENVIKKGIDRDAIIDIVQEELEHQQPERNNLNLIDYIYHTISNHNSIEDCYAVANTIVIEVHDSLHTVASIAMDVANNGWE